MTSRKEFTLNNVFYVSHIPRNLVLGSLLNEHGFHLVFVLTNLYALRLVFIWVKDMNAGEV